MRHIVLTCCPDGLTGTWSRSPTGKGLFNLGSTLIAFTTLDKLNPDAEPVLRKALLDRIAASDLPPSVRKQYEIQVKAIDTPTLELVHVAGALVPLSE